MQPAAAPPSIAQAASQLDPASRPCRRLRLFELFPVLLGIAVTWVIAAVLTASGTYNNASPQQQASCKTNNLTVLNNSPWIRFPYPGKSGSCAWRLLLCCCMYPAVSCIGGSRQRDPAALNSQASGAPQSSPGPQS